MTEETTSSADPAEEYTQLTRRLSGLRERRAVLKSQEEKKAEERETLEVELKARGVDTTNLGKEQERLEREIREGLTQAAAEVDQFETALRLASGEHGNSKMPEKVTLTPASQVNLT